MAENALTNVSKVEAKESDRSDVRMRTIGSSAKCLLREERILQILAKRATESICNLKEKGVNLLDSPSPSSQANSPRVR